MQVGIPVTVLEREGGPRREGSAIGLWPNAFRALDALGVAEPLRAAHPLFDRSPDRSWIALGQDSLQHACNTTHVREARFGQACMQLSG